MSEADDIGSIVTGGLIARAVEHARGDGVQATHGEHDGAGGECANCGAMRVGGFCHVCGQSGHIHRNVAALGHDIAHGVFHFEGKIWKTLPQLILHPGELTRRYIHGQRARFVSPMALFLFSVFLLFAAVNRLTMPDVAGAKQGLVTAKEKMSDAAEQAQDKLDNLKEKKSDLLEGHPKADTTDLDKKIADTTNEVAALKTAAASLPIGSVKAPEIKQIKVGDNTYNTDLATGVKSMNIDTGSSSLNQTLGHIRDNPELYAYKLKMASYKYSWALIPISVPFIWLLFCFRRDVGLYDHAIFAIYSLSFMTLLVVALIGMYMCGISQSWLWLAFLFVPPVHMYKQLKGAYLLSRFSAVWRTVMLLIMTTIAGSLFFALIMWLEAE